MADHTEDPGPGSGSVETEQDKLKHAMEQKKQQSWQGVGGAEQRDVGGGKGDSHRAGGSRQFRRKSG